MPLPRSTSTFVARPRRRLVAVSSFLLALLVVGVIIVLSGSRAEPSTPLGASVGIDGGVVRISGVIPLEDDGWVPTEPAPELRAKIAPGNHRVRVLVELTALEPQGLQFDGAKYSIDGLGLTIPRALWSSPVRQAAAQGETIRATLVFELPDRAIALTLEDGHGARLSLGAKHHTTVISNPQPAIPRRTSIHNPLV